MAFSESWSVLEPDLETVFDHEADPLQALADARIPGLPYAVLIIQTIVAD